VGANARRDRDPADSARIDADLALPLGPVGPTTATVGRDTLLTGGSGFLGAFLLRELLDATGGRVHCLVRARDAAHAFDRLVAAARRYRLPDPDPARVVAVPGDLIAAESAVRAGIGRVVHAAARVVFTEPYRVLRPDVLGTVALLRGMRAAGVTDLTYVSSIAACGPALGSARILRESRDQPLDPSEGGYGVVKWVSERLLERAERDGLRVRVFRPGQILGATGTGACNPRDVVWQVVAGALAVGAYPLDERPLPAAPVDVVARAIVGLGADPGAVGRAYHLVDRAVSSPRRLFEALAEAGLPARGLPLAQWQRLVAEHALSTRDDVLAGVALYELDGQRYDGIECAGWQDWLARTGASAAIDGAGLRRSVAYLATQPGFESLKEFV
jgi:thioester reductase-like protein